MLFVLLFAAVALGTLALVCLPLLRAPRAAAERGQFDRAVYRDQLAEVERDVARGVLNADEAASARLEVQRRLLGVDAASPARTVRAARSPRLAGVVALLVLGGAAGLYWRLGAPGLPDSPFAGHSSPNTVTARAGGHLDLQEAAVRLAQKLKTDPANGESWLLYARTEAMLNHWPTAGDAYRRAIDLGQKAPDVFAGYGEMLVLAEDGIVSPAAHDAFASALAADPKNDVARYYLALADSQAGEVKRAIDAWLALAADVPDPSPMREEIARAVAQTAKTGGIAAPPLPKGTAPQSGPDEQQIDAAAQVPEAARKEMIGGMVAQLAARLQSQPDDVEGWLRLGRAYTVLGETDKSVDAFEHAAKLKPDDVIIKLQTFQAMIAGLQPSDALPPRAVALLRQVAAIMPDQPEVLWYLGVDAARAGNTEEARRNWTRLLGALPAGGEDAKLVKSALDALPGK